MEVIGDHPPGGPTRTLCVGPMGVGCDYSTMAAALQQTTYAVDVALSAWKPEKPGCSLR